MGSRLQCQRKIIMVGVGSSHCTDEQLHSNGVSVSLLAPFHAWVICCLSFSLYSWTLAVRWRAARCEYDVGERSIGTLYSFLNESWFFRAFLNTLLEDLAAYARMCVPEGYIKRRNFANTSVKYFIVVTSNCIIMGWAFHCYLPFMAELFVVCPSLCIVEHSHCTYHAWRRV